VKPLGDALGAPVEFLSLSEIRRRFGSEGVTGYAEAHGRRGVMTDDTQMTLFTAEGLIRADNRFRDRGLVSMPFVVHNAYRRWLVTQGERPIPFSDFRDEWLETGWLIEQPILRHRRAPGTTCITALRGTRAGSIEEPLNDSKGCGGVMRIAPVGLVTREPFSDGIELERTDTLPYSGPQYAVLARLLKALCRRYGIRHVVGHSDSAPGRKTDPGPAFDWSRLARLITAGHSRGPR